MKKEQWKPIKDFEDYEISNFGRVRSRKNSNHLISLKFDMYKGYKRVDLYKKNKRTRSPIHRLVAKNFLEQGKHKVVNHIDSNPSNNHISNLEWCSQKENLRKSVARVHNAVTCYTCRLYRRHMRGKT